MTNSMTKRARSRQKTLGQYMTPPAIADRMASFLELRDGISVCDPACGTGELLLACLRKNTDIDITGMDVDTTMVAEAQSRIMTMTDRLHITQQDAFDVTSRDDFEKFDRVIANPPYFEVRKDDVRLKGENGFTGFAMLDGGRINVYGLFVERCVRLLKDDGIAVILIPPSMNNGRYFASLRERLLKLTYIERIEVIRDSTLFDGATQSVQIIVLRRSEASPHENIVLSQDWLWRFDDGTLILTDDVETIRDMNAKASPLTSIGLHVSTGNIIWNQHKDEFVIDDGPHDGLTRCVFSRDITDRHELVMSDKIQANGHWLDTGNVMKPDAIVVNRIVGSIASPDLRFAKVGIPFCAENHVNVIIGDKKDINTAFQALASLDSGTLSRYLQATTGSTQVSARELERLPIIPKGKEEAVNVSDGETTFMQGFVRYIRGEEWKYEVDGRHRPKNLRGCHHKDIESVYRRLKGVVEQSTGTGLCSITYSRDNRTGSDFEANDVSFEIKLGQATDINAGFNAIYENLMGGRGPLGDFVSESAISRRRHVCETSGVEKVREMMREDVRRIVEWYADTLEGKSPPDNGSTLLDAYSAGITNATEALSSTSYRHVVRVCLQPDLSWKVSDTRYHTGRWTLHDFSMTKAGRFVFHASDASGNNMRFLLNWKNRWKSPDGTKMPSWTGCSPASFNCWWL